MANVKTIIAAHLSQRQRQINKQAERAELLGDDRLLCNIIRVDSNIDVPSRPGFVWCQEYSPSSDTSPFHAFNDKVQAREGLVVWVGEGLGGRREVLDWHNGTITATPTYAAQKYLPQHGSDHQWPDFKPGPDAVNVYPRALTMLRAYPGEAGALTVSVAALRYIKAGAIVTFPGTNSFDISASQPASGLARFVGIYLDWDDNTIKSVNGATTSDSPAITPDSPTFPTSAILSVMVRLDGDQTTFSEVDFVDARQVLTFAGPGAVQVSEIWESDFGAVALEADATGNLTLNGTRTLTIPTDLIHAGDTDNKISFTDDVQTYTVGGEVLLTLTEDTQDVVKIGDGGDVDINFNDDMFLEGSSGNFGIGTTTIPHGAVGVAKVAIEGPNASSSGPHMQFTTAADDYPLIQYLNYTHDNIQWMFDAYFDGAATRSSDAGSNFRLVKASDLLRFEYDSGVAQGSVVTWNAGITLDASGQVGIGLTAPTAKLHVDQASTTAAVPVISIDQADLSEEFLNFITTVGAGNPIDTAAIGTYYGKARVAVNGTFKFVALYNS